MPCKTPPHSRGETCSSIGKHKTKYAFIVDADESVRTRLEGLPQRYHEDHIAAKGIKFTESLQFGAQIYSDASSIKKYLMQSCSGKRMGNLEKILAWQLTKVNNKKDVIDEARNKVEKFFLRH